jgi:hypothetical protein
VSRSDFISSLYYFFSDFLSECNSVYVLPSIWAHTKQIAINPLILWVLKVKRREVSGVLGGKLKSGCDDNNNDNKWKTCRISQLKRKGENLRIDICDNGRG